MLSFWDKVWAVTAMTIRDYYKEVEDRNKRWEKFCEKCTSEIASENIAMVGLIEEIVEMQPSSRIHNSLALGLKELSLFAFYLIIKKQGQITKEQEKLIRDFFKNIDYPFTFEQYIQGTKINNGARQQLLDMVDISDTFAGEFWLQYFKLLYRTEAEPRYINRLVESFSMITMHFAALSGKEEDYVLDLLSNFLEKVQIQSVKCRELPDDEIDIYGDEPFVEHFNNFKKDTYAVCNYAMDEDDEDLNPTALFQAFSVGIIYQIIRRCKRSRVDKIKMMDDILSQIDIGISLGGEEIFRDMEDVKSGEYTTMLSFYAHTFTDIVKEEPLGWILITRFSGTYNLDTKKEVFAIKEAINFLIGMENYLERKYPMSGFGEIASDYARNVLRLINKDIDENVTIFE